ncbi:MAG: trehalose-phosphatase [Janthinobacterium lividum]
MPSVASLPALDTTAFFFDFDGTLCALAPTPDGVQVAPRVPVLLGALRDRSNQALAIVTGRPIGDIDRFLAPLHLPIAGSHGAERRGLDGETVRVGFGDPRLRDMQRLLEEVVAAHPGLLLEVKGAGLAVHYRAAPQHAAVAERATQQAVALHGDAFVLQPGKMVFEIKPQGVDKGRAIRHFMTGAPFAGRTPLFAGDDLTDEKGFAVVNELGGLSVKIGEGETLATLRLPSVEAFVDWLGRVVDAAG